MIRVLLVDDQPLIRLGLGAILRSEDEIEVVGEAADGRAAIELAAALGRVSLIGDEARGRLVG